MDIWKNRFHPLSSLLDRSPQLTRHVLLYRISVLRMHSIQLSLRPALGHGILERSLLRGINS